MRTTLFTLAMLSGFCAPWLQAASTEEGHAFFEKRIRPLLEDHCYDCHSTDAGKSKGDLLLDTREGWKKGGESGTAITPGKPDDSLIIRAVRYWDKDLQMPPKTPLSPEQVKDLIEWVKMGAPDPRSGGTGEVKKTSKIDFEAGRKHWAFQPVKPQPRPPVKNSGWPRNEVDFFTLARMEELGAAPAPDASPRALIRRVTFDLIGLPPTPEEVEAFVQEAAANQPAAVAKLVDRLLATPQYGERWGRHWLDVVRYADTCGNASDYPVPQVFKYRDYVIAAFNADRPYDQFVREQIAGDLYVVPPLGGTNEAQGGSGTSVEKPAATGEPKGMPLKGGTTYADRVVATGYLASARHFAGGSGERHLTIEDAIENMGRTFLGLSLSCARCHDHKFDPISTADYYALYGVFDSTTFPHPGSEGKNRPENLVPLLARAELEPVKKEWEAKLAALDAAAKKHDEVKAAAEKEADTPERKAKVDQARKERDAVREQRKQLAATPPWEVAYAVSEGKPGDARIQVRGDPTRLGEAVPRRFPTVLGAQPLAVEKASGRRELAEAIVSPSNPLTARVMVNRIWQYHFGQGLVTTPNDFGIRGQAPSHPALLDFLAQRFVESGWSVKAMHRLILNSRTWQLASHGGATSGAASYAVYPRVRLDAESIRDALLAVSGDLDPTPGGAHPFPPVHTWSFTQHNQFFATYDTPKRTVYQMQQRLRRHPFLQLFDGPDPNSSTATRQSSTTPLQSLFVMNDPFVHQRAAKFAARVMREKTEDPARIERAFQILYARPPESEEIQMALAYLTQLSAKQLPPDKAWQSLSRAMLAANEFIYLD